MGEVADDIGKAAGDLWKDVLEGSKQIGEAIGYGGVVESERTKRQRRAAFEASRPRRPASIDQARTRQLESDRLRRRQGVLANIFGGASGGNGVTVGTKTLLGS